MEIASVAGLKLINQGNTAEIYEYGEDKIIKLFREGLPQEMVIAEFQSSIAIQSVLENVPKVYELVSIEGRHGIVCEYIKGMDMLKVMLKNIGKVSFYSKQLAHYHFAVHQNSVDIGHTVKEKLASDLNFTDKLSDDEKTRIGEYIEQLPDGDKLCHFDFHPGNIMLKGDSPIIIDWMTVCTGNPHADVARTYLLLQYGEMPHMNVVVRKMIAFSKKYICKRYYREYQKISGATESEIEQWILPVAAARLMEWLTESEKKTLLKLVRDRLALLP